MTALSPRCDVGVFAQPPEGFRAGHHEAGAELGSGSGTSGIPASGMEKLFSQEAIRRRVMKIARQINRDYRGRTLHLVTVLESSFVFVADLMRALRVDVVCHFLNVKMRDGSMSGVPLREIVYSHRPQLAGQDVLLVDGILETGITLDYLCNSIAMQRPRSLRTAALLEKSGRKKVGLAADYLGFAAQSGYLVGYGLGRGGKFQNLPYIAAVSPPRRTRKPQNASNRLGRGA
ncbi:MAG: phosphoribosyltransferase [Terriglobia bacterium]